MVIVSVVRGNAGVYGYLCLASSGALASGGWLVAGLRGAPPGARRLHGFGASVGVFGWSRRASEVRPDVEFRERPWLWLSWLWLPAWSALALSGLALSGLTHHI